MADFSEAHQRIAVLGSSYSAINFQEMVERLLIHAKSGKPGYVCVSNVHTTMTGFFDPAYRRVTNESTYSVPDGQPVRLAMRLLGASGQERVRGPSLMKALCDRGRAEGLRHYLYGGSPETLECLVQVLQQRYPGISIVGAESPPYRALNHQEIIAATNKINASGAEILWVGLGAPKQELWMWDQKESVRPLMMGIGAAFDLLAGKIPEAPAWMQAIGMEWFFRLYREPRRLWRRYIFNNPVFLALFAWQFLSERILRRNSISPERGK